MKKFFLVILIGATLMASVGCAKKGGNASGNVSNAAIPVETKKVEKSNINQTIDLVGTLYAWKEANLGAQTTGRIEKIFVEEGNEVKEGALLFQMDDTQLAQAKIQYEVAKDDYNRMKPLNERGSISKQQFDKVKAGYETAEYAYKLLLANTQFKAPFSGVITSKKLNEGEVFLLAPGGSGAPAVVTLMQLNPLKLKAGISEMNFKDIQLGQNADVQADAYPGILFSGVIDKINPTINPATRTFDIEIKIPNDERKLRPGMYVNATIHLGQVSVLVVDRSAILKQIGTFTFYAFVTEGDKAVRRTVKTGKEFEDKLEIIEGLNEGDNLIVTGQVRVKDGSTVAIKRAGETK
jgi:RND family efflux transporter MFP subunit